MNTFLLRLVACLLVAISSSSHAALYDRGNGLIYDDVLDITWMQDANYAETSGYAAANTGGGTNLNYVEPDGRMTWAAANSWAAQLEYAGYDDWRLPSTILDLTPNNWQNPIYQSSGEMREMYFTNFGCDYPGTTPSSCENSNNVSLFTNLRLNSEYWYLESEPEGKYRDRGFSFYFNGGSLPTRARPKTTRFHAWAVHDGDIGAAVIPIPATAWLFGSALAGLLVARSKNKE